MNLHEHRDHPSTDRSTKGVFYPGDVFTDAQSPNKAATILLVEDEECVRTVTKEVLESEGYTVLEAADANDGIEVCERHHERIDLLLSDVVMPGMNGRDMARKIIEIKPDLRVIFMSGYTDNPVLREAFSDSTTVYLQKPFTVDTLRTRIRQVLEGRIPSGD
ncbi:MAG TPA: response regulator [Candidatus Nanoarchaeia archaeon]|nr:response regulator [Candidatus Nanoarchaeia archaeon]